MRDDKRGLNREHAGGRLADAEFEEDRGEETKVANEKDDLAGPPLPTVRGVAATSAAQDEDNCSSR